MFNWLMGFLCALVGLALLAWVAFNFLVEMQPQAKGREPFSTLLFSFLAIGAGVSRLRRAFLGLKERRARKAMEAARETVEFPNGRSTAFD